MKNYLKYELAKQPPSLFDKGILRKGNKSTLGNILKTKSSIHSELPDDACFVLDGGHLLHVVPWPADGTYRDVCLTYISYVEHHYGQNTTVVFDGYSNMHSTKSAEQRRRAALTPSADIIFELDMKATTPKTSFLANNNNKARLIDKLMLELQHIGINCKQHESDADHLIISTAMEIAGLNPKPIVVVGTDTDLLVMLVAQCLPNMNIFMLFQHSPAIMYNIYEIQEAHDQLKTHLLAAHALTGCDTVSVPYMRGKKKAVEILLGNQHTYLDSFTNNNSTHLEIE